MEAVRLTIPTAMNAGYPGQEGGVVFAGLLPHAPVLIPEIGKRALHQVTFSAAAMRSLASRLVATKPEGLVVISPHSPRRSWSFGVWSGTRLFGSLEEFGFPTIGVHLPNDSFFAAELHSQAARVGLRTWEIPSAPADHGALVPSWYVAEAGWAGPTTVVGLSSPGKQGLAELGQAIALAAGRLERRVAVLASGDLSHRLTAEAPGGYEPRGEEFDLKVLTCLRRGEYRELQRLDPELVQVAGQDALDSIIVAAAAAHWEATAHEVLSYEGPFGVGYAVAVLFSGELGSGTSTSAALTEESHGIRDKFLPRESVKSMSFGTAEPAPLRVHPCLDIARGERFTAAKSQETEVTCSQRAEPVSNRPVLEHPARWWRMQDDGRIQCELCPRSCRLKEGQRGFCFVRQRLRDRMVLTAYGSTSGLLLDPIEKKPLNHFYPGTSVLSFGTIGCNLGCRFCQNWHLSKARDCSRLTHAASPDGIVKAAQQLGCKAVAFTYNDPVIFAEYAIDVALACHAAGIQTVAVTAGYITPEPRAELFRQIDAVNVDLKGFSDEFYRKRCLSRLTPVLETLEYLHSQTNLWLEVTSLLIPGENDQDEQLHRAAEWFVEHLGREVPWHFTAFHPDFKMLETPHTPFRTLQGARRIALSKGLHYVYTGNVNDPAGASTWCPRCQALLIERRGYELGHWSLAGDRCPKCGCRIAGRFADQHGTGGTEAHAGLAGWS